MAIDDTEANRIRVAILGRSVDTLLTNVDGIPTTFTSTGNPLNWNALDEDLVEERVINRAINEVYDRVGLATTATNGFAGRFNNVIGNEAGADQVQFQALGGNLIQAVAALKEGDGSGGSGNATSIQGRAVASTAPTNGQALVWNQAGSEWRPGTVSGGPGDGGSIVSPEDTRFGRNLTPNAASYTVGYLNLTGGTPQWSTNWVWEGSSSTNIIAYTLTEPTVPDEWYWLTYNIGSNGAGGPPMGAVYFRTSATATAEEQFLTHTYNGPTYSTGTSWVGQPTRAFTHLVMVSQNYGTALLQPRLYRITRNLAVQLAQTPPTITAAWQLAEGSATDPFGLYSRPGGTSGLGDLVYQLAQPMVRGKFYVLMYSTLLSSTSGGMSVVLRTSATESSGQQGITTSFYESTLTTRTVMLEASSPWTHLVAVGAGGTSSATSRFQMIGIWPIEGEPSPGTMLDGAPLIFSNDGNLQLGTVAPFTTGFENVTFGRNALQIATTANRNVAIGNNALRDATSAGQNIAIGEFALARISTGTQNVVIGANAGRSVTSSSNVIIGGNALPNATSVTSNVAIGPNVGNALTTGWSNVLIGNYAGSAITSGGSNVFLGTYAGRCNNSGSNSVAIGPYALGDGTAYPSESNVAIGYYASADLTAGTQNVSLGYFAGRYRTGTTKETEYNNSVYIGHNSRSGGSARTNQIVIGYDAQGEGSNTIRLGNTSILTNGLYCRATTIQSSDARLKQNIEPADLDLCLRAVKALPVRRFHWDERYTNCNDKHVTGFVADDVEKVFPKMVVESDEEFNGTVIKGCKHTGMADAMPTLWGAVQKLIEKNEDLEREIAELRREKHGGHD